MVVDEMSQFDCEWGTVLDRSCDFE